VTLKHLVEPRKRLVGLAAEWPFISQVDYTGPLVKYLDGADISWIVGFFVAAIVFLVLVMTSRSETGRHDRQMAYVQGLTHLLARIVLAMDVPAVDHATQTYGHLQSMVEMVRHDSDELFDTILGENPFAAEVLAAFWDSAARVTRLRR